VPYADIAVLATATGRGHGICGASPTPCPPMGLAPAVSLFPARFQKFQSITLKLFFVVYRKVLHYYVAVCPRLDISCCRTPLGAKSSLSNRLPTSRRSPKERSTSWRLPRRSPPSRWVGHVGSRARTSTTGSGSSQCKASMMVVNSMAQIVRATIVSSTTSFLPVLATDPRPARRNRIQGTW
jgi:hypothetical protein